MKIRSKILAPIALSLAIMVGFVITMQNPANSETKTETKIENNMKITSTAEGEKNGPYNFTITVQQNNSPEYVPFQIDNISARNLNLMLENNAHIYYNKNGEKVQLRCLHIGDRYIFRAGMTTVGNSQGYRSSDVIDWANSSNLSILANDAFEATSASILTITFKDDFNFTGLEPDISDRNATSNWDKVSRTLTITNYNYSASPADTDAAPLTINFSNVPLADKSAYLVEDVYIDMLDLNNSSLTISDTGYNDGDGRTTSLPQAQVLAGPYYYFISYDVNGGKEEETPAEDTSGPTADESYSTVITETEPSRDDYTFLGWSTDPNATEPDESYAPGTPITLTKPEQGNARAINLYAVWTENQVTINYVATTGGSVDNETETSGVINFDPIGATATPDEDYEFVNWIDAEGTVVSTDPFFVPTESVEMTYTAVFKAIKKEVTPDPDGAIDVIKPTIVPSSSKDTTNPKTAIGVNISVFGFILLIALAGLTSSLIIRAKN